MSRKAQLRPTVNSHKSWTPITILLIKYDQKMTHAFLLMVAMQEALACVIYRRWSVKAGWPFRLGVIGVIWSFLFLCVCGERNRYVFFSFLWLMYLFALPNKHCMPAEIWRGEPSYTKWTTRPFGSLPMSTPPCALILYWLCIQLSARLLQLMKFQCSFSLQTQLPRNMIFPSWYITQPVVPYAGEPKEGQNQP